MGMFSLVFAVRSVTSEVTFYSYFPSKHLSRLPSVPQVHRHIFQNTLKEKYTRVYVAELCVVDIKMLPHTFIFIQHTSYLYYQ